MKRKLFLTTILLTFCGFGLLTLSSSIPAPDYSIARVYWFDGLTCDAEVHVDGYLYGGGTGSESFTATYSGSVGSPNPHKDYNLENAYTWGTIHISYYYVKNGQTIHYTNYWQFSKTSQEAFDQLIEIPVCKYPEE
ncbi:MAG: hypothetical protein D4R64_16110 [Porphyromonadaceae bacterium]|nr:MAG: hypothetical protein D4R64_16110 [Porphyromonadaceae bacterium]